MSFLVAVALWLQDWGPRAPARRLSGQLVQAVSSTTQLAATPPGCSAPAAGTQLPGRGVTCDIVPGGVFFFVSFILAQVYSP